MHIHLYNLGVLYIHNLKMTFAITISVCTAVLKETKVWNETLIYQNSTGNDSKGSR